MQNIRIGLILGLRQIQRANIWTTLLIIFVMMLTFLNLIVVSGVLVGLIAGAENAVKEESLGDIVISPLDGEDRILETEKIASELETYPEVSSFAVRHQASGVLEANYQERRNLSKERDIANVTVTGIEPVRENEMSNLADNIIAGEYLKPGEEGYILIGYYYLEENADLFGDIFESLQNITPGVQVRLTVGDRYKEFTVKGIVQSKVDEVSLNTYISEREFRRLYGRVTPDADQIAVRTSGQEADITVQKALLENGLDDYAKIQLYEEAKPKFITDIKNTMNLLGTFIGSIGIVVASITIFIIIFINALSRRQQIGILKGIGIERRAIEIAYVIQSAFYALCGSALGALLTYGFLIGYFEQNPIKFPFSDGILVAPVDETLIRSRSIVCGHFAGLIPAWLIVRQNTLNSILGRK